jgi:signal transduction histidine kinase
MPSETRLRRLAATVRFRITALATLAVFAVLVLTGIALVVAQRQVLTEKLDESLVLDAAAIEADIATDPSPGALAPVGDDDGVAQVVDSDGDVIAATTNAAGEPPIAAVPDGDQVVRTVDGLPTDDAPFRVVSRRVEGPDGPLVIHVAAPLDDVRETTSLLTTSLAIAIPAVTAVLAWLVWWLVGRTLRPVEAIRSEVAGMSGSDLDRRVPVPPGDDEVAELARTMNAMLDRVEDAAQRQQRFVADASHELRSPLARIRSEIEVDLAHPYGADPEQTSRSVLDETIGMQRLVDDLLVLARSDAGAVTAARTETVDLDDVVARHSRRLRADGRVAVDTRAVGAAQVAGDPQRLGRAIGNVVDNAVRHARATVTFGLAEQAGEAVLTVTDDGPGIPPDRRDEVFERFTRLDGARVASTGGTGLGLAIAREIIEDHHGTIWIDPDHYRGARFVITLPLVTDEP